MASSYVGDVLRPDQAQSDLAAIVTKQVDKLNAA
jgi:hypothetical protein